MSDNGAGQPAARAIGDDPRIRAVHLVLAGEDAAEVAADLGLQAELVDRWVQQFVEAGTAAVRNRPTGREVAARDRLLAAVSHELRTPVSVIRGVTSLLGRDGLTSDQGKALRARLTARFEELDTLLHRLDETMQASLGRLELELRTTSMRKLLAPFEPEVVEDALLTVDVARVQGVVGDLVGLAHEGPATTQVRVRAGLRGTWRRVTVQRDGDPFAPEFLAAVLDPFTPRDGNEQVTFGLHLARSLVVLHGGQLGIERHDGHDELWVDLPASPPSSD